MAIPVSLRPNGITSFLKHIREAGIPTKVDNKYLQTIGFTSSNDRALIAIFKSLGFLDSGNTPTEAWKQYRGDQQQARRVLGDAIKHCYAGLFALYADADRRDDEAIANWIRANTDYSGVTVGRAVSTFKTLVASASFEGVPGKPEEQAPQTHAVQQNPAHVQTPEMPQGTPRPGITINVELQIPATTDATVYDNFFAAMKRHLFPDGI